MSYRGERWEWNYFSSVGPLVDLLGLEPMTVAVTIQQTKSVYVGLGEIYKTAQYRRIPFVEELVRTLEHEQVHAMKELSEDLAGRFEKAGAWARYEYEKTPAGRARLARYYQRS